MIQIDDNMPSPPPTSGPPAITLALSIPAPVPSAPGTVLPDPAPSSTASASLPVAQSSQSANVSSAPPAKRRRPEAEEDGAEFDAQKFQDDILRAIDAAMTRITTTVSELVTEQTTLLCNTITEQITLLCGTITEQTTLLRNVLAEQTKQTTEQTEQTALLRNMLAEQNEQTTMIRGKAVDTGRPHEAATANRRDWEDDADLIAEEDKDEEESPVVISHVQKKPEIRAFVRKPGVGPVKNPRGRANMTAKQLELLAKYSGSSF